MDGQQMDNVAGDCPGYDSLLYLIHVVALSCVMHTNDLELVVQMELKAHTVTGPPASADSPVMSVANELRAFAVTCIGTGRNTCTKLELARSDTTSYIFRMLPKL